MCYMIVESIIKMGYTICMIHVCIFAKSCIMPVRVYNYTNKFYYQDFEVPREAEAGGDVISTGEPCVLLPEERDTASGHNLHTTEH